MAKRRASVENDSEFVKDNSPVSKRPRVDDADPVPSSSRPQKADKGKSKRKKEGNEEEDAEMGEPDDEEQAFEEKEGERIRDSILNKSKTRGGIAEHGIIESLEMHQFMCHKYLTFTFGPQINFIIGHNGSGKSAVLTALTVALGGKAGSTGRGTGLKSFIREGQPAAEVSVSIKNRGEEAYQPDLYGKSIIVTRKFNKDGASTWKIKNSEGKVVSTKRDELSHICDHMNIQVDNPMNVLTQDSARQFLSASTPGDKYKLFLRGTQLAQLSEEYDTCMENITQTSKVIAKKKEALPDLKAALKESTTRFEEASKAREQRHKADELKKELAWAHVADKEKDMQKDFESVAKAERRIPKVQERVAEAETQEEAATAEVQLYEEEYTNFGKPADLEQRKMVISQEIVTNKEKLKNIMRDQREMDAALKKHNHAIAGFEASIAQEEAKMSKHAGGRREQVQRQLTQAQEALDQVETDLRDIAQRRNEKVEERRTLEQESIAASHTANEKQTAARNNQMAMQQAKQAEKNKFAAFGQGMSRALDQIRHSRWHGEIPLGPFGQFVKVRDQKWAPVMRLVLGQQMFGFRITDGKDRQQLKQILEANKCRVNIVVSSADLFDYSQGEPSPDKLTFLRALEIGDEHVLRVLINSARIEKRLLFNSRYDAQEELRRTRGGGEAYTLDLFNVRNYGDGGEQSAPMPSRGGHEMALLFPSGDSAAQYRQFEEQQSHLDEEAKAAMQHETEIQKRMDAIKSAIAKLNQDERVAQSKHNKLKFDRNRLQEEANVEVPLGIAHIVAAKEESEAEKADVLAQFATAEQQKTDLDAQLKPLVQEQDDLRARLNDFEARKNAIGEKVQAAVQKRMEAQASVNHYKAKLREEERKVQEAKEKAAKTEGEFQEWTAKATEYCNERFENPRDVAQVERLLASVQNALKDRAKRNGATVEEMTIEVNKAEHALNAVDKEIKQMAQLNKMLKRSLQSRTSRWQEFRLHIALRTRLIFQYNLANRGYYGKVLFNHEQEQLQLKVQTDDLANTQSKEKDPRSLSGGEKSFSTICLLLALWEAINCPIRCLDEFDVFMDAVNRRISMKMMIETANASHQKQYILITPQDMNNVHIGKTVRVHRMTDPERGQGTLAFNN